MRCGADFAGDCSQCREALIRIGAGIALGCVLCDAESSGDAFLECYAVVKKEFDRLLPYEIRGLPNSTA